MSDPIERLVGVLRQPAVPAELEGESIAIGTMMSAVRPTAAHPNVVDIRAGRARKLRVASFVAAGVIGFGTVAAAGPGSFADSSFETIVDDAGVPAAATSSTTSTTEAPTPDALIAAPGDTLPDEPLVDDPDTEFDETQCADGNHGQTVSSVARTPGRTSEDVRNAAHSSCGKKDKKDKADKDDESEIESDEVDDDEKDKKDKKDKADKPDKDKDHDDESEETESDEPESDEPEETDDEESGSRADSSGSNGQGEDKGKKDKKDKKD